VQRIGFLVNPIAGMGGRVGLKGTDGVVEEARAAGAVPQAPARAATFLQAFWSRHAGNPRMAVRWLTCSGPMGGDVLEAAGGPPDAREVVHRVRDGTTAEDTKAAARALVSAGVELVLFCGGDGTARDVAEAVGDLPMLGIPAGVKMHSGVFAVSPAAAAEILAAFLRGELRTGHAEVLDLDEEAYRKGEWRIRLFGTAKTLIEPHLVQAGKLMVAEISEADVLAELAEHVGELLAAEPDTLFLLGPGSTLHTIAERLGLEKTLLGIDAVLSGATIAKDLNEAGLLALLDRHPPAKLVVSPIGAQGFILGRGNLQVSPAVLRRIGTRNVLVVGTPGKLASTPVLRVDTGDEALDAEFHKREYLFVIVGYRTSRLMPIEG